MTIVIFHQMKWFIKGRWVSLGVLIMVQVPAQGQDLDLAPVFLQVLVRAVLDLPLIMVQPVTIPEEVQPLVASIKTIMLANGKSDFWFFSCTLIREWSIIFE